MISGINNPASPQIAIKDDLKKNEKSFSEELLIRTDRDLYATGEKVWFKINILNSLTIEPVTVDKVAYLDILDLENNPIDQLKIGMTGYTGSGNFIIPDTLRSGNYLLRACTHWMQNFSSDLFAYKIISVINPFEKISDLHLPVPEEIPDSIIFYPEGGHLLCGVDSKLGIRTLGRGGKPLKIDCILTDDKHDTLSLVHTGNNGYGIVSVNPSDSGMIYLMSQDKAHPWKYRLPIVQNEGILLTAVEKNKNSGALVRISVKGNINPDGNKFRLEVRSSGLSGSRKLLLPAKAGELLISDSDIPYGLSHFVIEDLQGRDITDRWICKDRTERLKIEINPLKHIYSAREKVSIDIAVTDHTGKPVEGDFSISVAKAVTTFNRAEDNENLRKFPGLMPVYEDCLQKEANDYLVFYKPHDSGLSSDGVSNNDSPSFLPEIQGHLISGTIRDRISNEPLPNENITLSFVGKAALCLFTKTDTMGNFNFVTNEHGLQEIVIQPLNPTKECYVDLKNPFPSGFNEYDHGLFSIDTLRMDEINNMIISMQVCNIYSPFYNKPVREPADRKIANFYGKPDNEILMSQYISLTSVKEIVTDLIPGVITTRNNGQINFRMTKPYQTRPFDYGPLVMVDGIPVYELEKVIGMNSNDIEKVDVLIDRYYISGNILDGILHFITKKGDLSVYDLDRSVFRMEYNLPGNNDLFYSPDYSADSMKMSHLPDFRNTLYWNPDLHTDAGGKASAEFYSSDESGEYLVTVDAISPDGRRGTARVRLVIE